VLVTVKDLQVEYMTGTPFQVTALKGVSMIVQKGEILGLVGATGSGKSTFLQSIAGLVDLCGGTIEYAEGIDRARLYTKVGMVFQMPEDQLFERTVMEDVGFGPKQLGWPAEKIAKVSRQALQRVGLDPVEFGPRAPQSLSGGEKRRVAIAGILSMQPEILLLDEPTAGLDAQSQRRLLDIISGLNKEGTTVLMVTHDLHLLLGLATRVAVFSRGELRTVGPAAKVLGKVDVLHEVGLRAPFTVELMAALSARGLPIEPKLLSVAETAAEVARAVASGKPGRA
jgi:energy-coupling factor transport system ATP-binding protein